MPGNVRIAQNPTYDTGFLTFALGKVGVTAILTEPNGTVECTMTDQQVTTFQNLYPQYQLTQVTPVQPDETTQDTYVDNTPAQTDPDIDQGVTVTPDPSPN